MWWKYNQHTISHVIAIVVSWNGWTPIKWSFVEDIDHEILGYKKPTLSDSQNYIKVLVGKRNHPLKWFTSSLDNGNLPRCILSPSRPSAHSNCSVTSRDTYPSIAQLAQYSTPKKWCTKKFLASRLGLSQSPLIYQNSMEGQSAGNP